MDRSRVGGRGSSQLAHSVFVGDAKYKRTGHGEIDDLYQLLAYCSASGLPQGLLIYGQSSAPTSHQVVREGPLLYVSSIDVTAPLQELLARCAEMAELIADLARGDDLAEIIRRRSLTARKSSLPESQFG